MSFIENLSWRYAAKSFNGSVVEADVVSAILEAIRFVPTSFGLQPFHVTIVENSDLKAKIRAAAWDQAQITSASHVFVFSARTDIAARIQTHLDNTSGGNAETRAKLKGFEEMMTGATAGLSADDLIAWCGKQSYIALGFALAACAELKVDSCPMEGFDKEKVKEILGLPEYMHVQTLMPIGGRDLQDTPRSKVRFSKEDLFDFRA